MELNRLERRGIPFYPVYFDESLRDFAISAELIKESVFFRNCVAFGCIFLIIYEFILTLQYFVRHPIWAVWMENILFVYLSVVSFVRFLLQKDHTVIRWYMFAGILAGMLLGWITKKLLVFLFHLLIKFRKKRKNAKYRLTWKR